MTDLNQLQDISSWRILIVDDEPDNLQLVSDLLSFSGATVQTTENPTVLLEMVDSFEPNIIVLDLSMPVMDGWTVHVKLRERDDLAHVPIVALTALAMLEDVDRARQAGFNGYITKPFRVSSLIRDLMGYINAFIEQQSNPDAESGADSIEQSS